MKPGPAISTLAIRSEAGRCSMMAAASSRGFFAAGLPAAWPGWCQVAVSLLLASVYLHPGFQVGGQDACGLEIGYRLFK